MIAIKSNIVNAETGKRQLRFFCSLKNSGIPDEYWRKFGEGRSFDLDGLYLVDEETGEVHNRATLLPCGQCLGCRTAYAASWANRIMLEAKDHDESYMITLTYDDEHIPVHETKDGNTVYSLEPHDLQDFMKRLRRNQEYHFEGNKIRFYGVGEYGERFHRPHYHVIVFGLHLDDICEFGRNRHGTVLHKSDIIDRLWSKGLTEVSPLNWEDAAYVARYTVKKLGKKETDFYESQNLVPEFSRMSLKPAIGWKYFDENMQQIYKNDEILIELASGLRKVKPPRYYDEKYDDIYPSHMEEIKGNRKEIARQHLMLKLDRFSGTYLELLHNEEIAFKQRTKLLRRELET